MEENKIANPFKVLLIGGSAGSLEVLLSILPRLQPLPGFAIVIVLHRKESDDNTLEELFTLKSSIPVCEIEDKTPVHPGFMYIAPSGYHLLFETNGEFSLDASEKVNYSRPSIDVAFESAAGVYGPAITAILLSGANADGTMGMTAVKDAGGITVVQDPQTAEMPFMPQSVLDAFTPGYTIASSGLLAFINGLAGL